MKRFIYNLPLRIAARICEGIANLYAWVWEDGDRFNQDNDLAYEHQKLIWEARKAAKEIRASMIP
jgi:hypothetical protein